MDAYSWIALLTLIGTVLALWKIRKRKEYQYSLLDTSGIILNAVLGVMVYPPLSVAGALLELYRYATTPLQIVLEGAAVAMGRLMPTVAMAGIGASIILRRKEQPAKSFLLQFVGVAWFAVIIVLAKLSGSY